MASLSMSELAQNVNGVPKIAGNNNNTNNNSNNKNYNNTMMMSSNNINASFATGGAGASSSTYSPILKTNNNTTSNVSMVAADLASSNPQLFSQSSPSKKVGFAMGAAALLAIGLKKAGKAAAQRVADRRRKEKDINFDETDFDPASPSRPSSSRKQSAGGATNNNNSKYQLSGAGQGRSNSLDSLANDNTTTHQQLLANNSSFGGISRSTTNHKDPLGNSTVLSDRSFSSASNLQQQQAVASSSSEQLIRPPTWNLIQQNAIAAAAANNNNNNNQNNNHNSNGGLGGSKSKNPATPSEDGGGGGFLSWAGQESPSQQRKYSPVRIARQAIERQKAAELKVRERLLLMQQQQSGGSRVSSTRLTTKTNSGSESLMLSPALGSTSSAIPGLRPSNLSRSNSPSKMSVATSLNGKPVLLPSSSSQSAKTNSGLNSKVPPEFANFSFGLPLPPPQQQQQQQQQQQAENSLNNNNNSMALLSSPGVGGKSQNLVRPSVLGTPPLAPMQQQKITPVTIDPNVYNSMSPEEQWAYYYSVVNSQQQQQQQRAGSTISNSNNNNNIMYKLHKERLTRFYQKYAPDNIAKIDQILEKYKGNEEVLFEAIRMKYGPEPPPPSTASPSPVPISIPNNNNSNSNASMKIVPSSSSPANAAISKPQQQPQSSHHQSQSLQQPEKQPQLKNVSSAPPGDDRQRADSELGSGLAKPLEHQSTMLYYSASPNVAPQDVSGALGSMSRPASFSMPPAAITTATTVPDEQQVNNNKNKTDETAPVASVVDKESLINFYLQYAAGQIDTDKLTQEQIQQLHQGSEYYQEREAATAAAATQQQQSSSSANAAAEPKVSEADMQGHSRDDLITFYLQYAQGMVDAASLTPEQIQLLHVGAKLYQEQVADQEHEEEERQRIAYERAMEHQRQQAELDEFEDDEMDLEYEDGEDDDVDDDEADDRGGHHHHSRRTKVVQHEMAVQTEPVKIITPGIEMSKAKEFLAKKKAIELRKLADTGNVVHLGELAGPKVPPIDAKKVVDSLVTIEEKKRILQSTGAQKLLFKDALFTPSLSQNKQNNNSFAIAGTMFGGDLQNIEYDQFGNVIADHRGNHNNYYQTAPKKPDSRHKAVPGVGEATMKDKMDSWFSNIAGESGLGLKTPFVVKLESTTSSMNNNNNNNSSNNNGGSIIRRKSQVLTNDSINGKVASGDNLLLTVPSNNNNYYSAGEARSPSSQPESDSGVYATNLVPQEIGRFKKSPVDENSVSWRAVASQIAAARRARELYQKKQEEKEQNREEDASI